MMSFLSIFAQPPFFLFVNKIVVITFACIRGRGFIFLFYIEKIMPYFYIADKQHDIKI